MMECMLMTIGGVWLSIYIVFPVIEAVVYAVGFTIAEFRFARKPGYFQQHPFKTVYYFLLKGPFRKFMNRLFGSDTMVNKVHFQEADRSWVPFFTKNFGYKGS